MAAGASPWDIDVDQNQRDQAMLLEVLNMDYGISALLLPGDHIELIAQELDSDVDRMRGTLGKVRTFLNYKFQRLLGCEVQIK
jgi:chromosomal replication initiation ATPase DnaA